MKLSPLKWGLHLEPCLVLAPGNVYGLPAPKESIFSWKYNKCKVDKKKFKLESEISAVIHQHQRDFGLSLSSNFSEDSEGIGEF